MSCSAKPSSRAGRFLVAQVARCSHRFVSHKVV
jgi:hypothetical protein